MLAEMFVHEIAHATWTASVGPCVEKPHTLGAYPEQGKEICNDLLRLDRFQKRRQHPLEHV
jgi:hypothetical protein